MKFFILLILLASCSSTKPSAYTPPEYHTGDSVRAMCLDALLEASPPRCADIGWCEQFGYSIKYTIFEDGPCTN